MRERIGSYRIERVLAEGGMGLVYKARHESLGRGAAIKTLLPKHTGDAALRARLLREAQTQARLEGDHVVKVYELIEENDELFIAMEYIDGENLARFLERQPNSRLTLGEALPLFDRILAALAFVHHEKIVHRDVKPSNVMLSGSDVKLTDFGIALLIDLPRITASTQRLGTPAYMSPEQLEGKSVDHRSDIYSAALVFYRMIAGRPAFEANEYLAHIQERYVGPIDLRTLVPGLPAGVSDAVAIALRHNRDERFSDVETFREALREGEVGFFVDAPRPAIDETPLRPDDVPTERLPTAVPPAPRSDSRRTPVLIAIVIVGTFAAAFAIIHKEPAPQSEVPIAVRTQTTAPVATLSASIERGSPAPRDEPSDPPRESPAVDEPLKPTPFPTVTTKSEPVEDLEATRRAGIASLRAEIRLGLGRAESELNAARFDDAVEELDHTAAMAQRDPVEFRDERAQIADLRTRLVEKRVAAEAGRKETARWASRLADIEEDLTAGRWPEAERFAKGIAADPSAPADVAERARTLLERAKEGWRNAFKGTQVGPTNNTIRKPLVTAEE